MRERWRGAVVAVATATLVAACGGGEGAAADPDPTEPEATSSAPAAQPEGANGVTWEIQNWDEHAEDPAVLTWKQFNEAFAASINQGELLPAARDLSAREVLDEYVGSLDSALANDYRSQDLTHVKVAGTEATDDGASLVLCVWSKTVELVTAEGEYVSDEDPRWLRQEAELTEDENGWTLTRAEYDGTCEGGDPT